MAAAAWLIRPGPADPVRASATAHGAHGLQLATAPPDGPSRLLWLAGRPAAPLGDGVVLEDGDGGVLFVNSALRAAHPRSDLARYPAGAVAGHPDGTIWVIDGSGRLRQHESDGTLRRELATVLPFASVTIDAGTGTVWLVRSRERFSYRLPGESAPMFERLGSRDTAFAPVGRAVLPEHSILADLHNAGHLVARNDTLWYAPFIRDEVLALSPAGDTLWRARRGLPHSTTEPRFELDSAGGAVVNYHPVNLGLQLTDDGRLLVLSTPDGEPSSGRLDAFDAATGRHRGTVDLGTAFPSLAIGPRGTLHRVDPVRVVIAGAPERVSVPDVELPMRDGSTFHSRAAREGPMVLNLWASWCLPCRRELPALDSLRRDLAPHGVIVLGLNDDRDSVAARRFLDEVAPEFPTAYGRGRLADAFRYLGLPLTVLVDREGRVAARWIGELTPERFREIRTAVALELRRMVPGEGGHGGHQ